MRRGYRKILARFLTHLGATLYAGDLIGAGIGHLILHGGLLRVLEILIGVGFFLASVLTLPDDPERIRMLTEANDDPPKAS